MVYQFLVSTRKSKIFDNGNFKDQFKFPDLNDFIYDDVYKYLYGNSEFFDDEIFSFQSSEDFVKYLIFSSN